jgi:alpha-L-fucosidase
MVFNMGAPTIRWVGNEDGVAPYPCWKTAEAARLSMFTTESADWLPSTPKWVPAECDVPIRKDQWFWHPDAEDRLHSLEHLLDIYYRSVGHGCNLLLNVAPDDRGLLPDSDVRRVLELGAEVRRRFDAPISRSSGTGNELVLRLEGETSIDHLVLMEDIRLGERIREYVVDALRDGQWAEIARGSAVGHKKIDAFPAVKVSAVRLRVLSSEGEPIIRSMSVYGIG